MKGKRVLKTLFMIINAYYDKNDEYAYFSTPELNVRWGFSKTRISGWLKELADLGLIENHTVNGFYNRYKILKPTKVPKFILNKDLTNLQKEFLLNCIQAKITKNTSKKEWSRRVYGYEDNKAVNLSIQSIEKSTGKSFWEIFDITPIEENLKPVGIKTEYGYKTEKRVITIRGSREENITANLLLKSLDSSKRRGFEHTLTQDYIREILERQNYKDYYTGLSVEDNDWSVDRIDCSKGYIQGNIVLTHKRINTMRNDQSMEEFKKNIIALYKNINNF